MSSWDCQALDLSGRDGGGDRLANGDPEQDHEAMFSTTAPWTDMWSYHGMGAVMRANNLSRCKGCRPILFTERDPLE